MPQEGREYDPEIKDIANYVTKPIDSELAVGVPYLVSTRIVKIGGVRN